MTHERKVDLPPMNFEASGVMFTSSPNRRVEQPAQATSAKATLLMERKVVLSEAHQMADFALRAIRQGTESIFQHQAYLNVVKERQDSMKKYNELILRPENFGTVDEYIRTRGEFGNEALALDIKTVEIQHAVMAMTESARQQHQQPRRDDASHSDHQTRKLETLRLEKFTGTVESWLSFWTRFEERVHNNSRLSNMEKYDYLRQYSAPNVLSRLKTIPLSAEFYQMAVNRLRDEFGTQDKVMAHFTEKLLNVGHVQSRYDLEALSSLVQLIKSSIAALRSVGMTVDHISPFFWPILRKALPVDVYLEFRAVQRSNRRSDDFSSTVQGNPLKSKGIH